MPTNHPPLSQPRPAAQPVPEVTKPSAPKTEAPGTLSVLDEAGGDALRAEQLTAQWKRAVQGEAEQHIFGAMMILLSQHLKVLSTRGQNSPQRGPRAKGKGLDTWLREHAPMIKRPTAYRWMQAAKGLVQKTGIAGAAELQSLLGTAADDLPEPQRAQQMELFSALEKHSQSELIAFAPKHRPGGNTYVRDGVKGKRHVPTVEEEREFLTDLWRPHLRFLIIEGLTEKSWALLPDDMMRDLKGILIDLNKLVPAK